MTPSKPTTAQDGPNAPQTVDTMPGAELDLVAIEKRLEAAFPGPWHWNGDYEIIGDGDYPGDYWILDMPDMHPIGYIMKTAESYEEGSANIELIANAPTDMAALVEEVKRLINLVSGYRRGHAVQKEIIDKLGLEIDHLRLEVEQLQSALEFGEQVRAGLEAHNELDRQERGRLRSQLADKGYTCACCNQWQPDGVGHRCGEGKEG